MPELFLKRFANVQQPTGHDRPSALDHNFEYSSHDSRRILVDIRRIADQRKPVHSTPRYVRLDEDVHFARAVLRAAHDWKNARLVQQVELFHFFVSGLDLGELVALGDQAEDFFVGHDFLEPRVGHFDGVVFDVVVAGCSAQVGRRENSVRFVESKHVGFVEEARGYFDQVLAEDDQVVVVLHGFVGEAVGERVELHADVQVGVAEPFDAFSDVGHAAQADLGVQVVGQAVEVLTFDWDLAREQTEVVSQFVVGCDYESFAALLKLDKLRTLKVYLEQKKFFRGK